MTEILGYNIITAMEALDAFIAKVEAQYVALEQAIAPVDEKIADLQKDWNPRLLAFWSEILRRSIPAIRVATASCLDLFDRKQSQQTPIPIVMCATHIGYTCDLSQIESQIEEAGILLTAYLCTPESKSVEAQIRERQRMMRALQQLSKAVHDAIDKGRITLKSAPGEQRRLLCPPKRQGLHLVGDDRQEGNGS